MLKYPIGMMIDSNTGIITWVPTNDQVGTHPIVVLISDPNGGETRHSFSILVENVNDPPEITSIPILTGTEEVVFVYPIEAEDMDLTNDKLTYELGEYPLGMRINSTFGIISWTPTTSQVGENNVIVLVSDGQGGSATQSFSINVMNLNDAPIIDSDPITSATEDVIYTYDVDALDNDPQDNLTYNLETAPLEMTIHAQTGLISWTPENNDVGSHQVVVKVVDNQNTYAIQSFVIIVDNVNDAPEMSEMSVSPESGNNRDSYVFTLKYKDPDGDEGSARVIINCVEHEMSKVGGDAQSGKIYFLELNLPAGKNTYYFEIDDNAGSNVAGGFSEVSVSAFKAEDEDDFFIPLWWIILILVIIIAVILIYLAKVKRQIRKHKQDQSQQMDQQPDNQ